MAADYALRIEDGRDDLPIFIHSDLDDLDMTPEAFRVYGHLARRAGKYRVAWPSYTSIGERCFRKRYPNAKPETLRRKAMAAVKELVDLGLIRRAPNYKDDGSQAANDYALTPRNEWGGCHRTGGGVTAPQGVSPHGGGVTAPKDTPIEDTPINEYTPTKKTLRSRSSRAEPPHPNTQPICQAYIDKLGYTPTNFGREAKAAKELAKLGFTPEEVVEAYQKLKAQSFYRERFLGLGAVLREIRELTNYTKGKEVQDGQVGSSSGYNPEEIAAIRAARQRGDIDEAGRLLRAANERLDAQA